MPSGGAVLFATRIPRRFLSQRAPSFQKQESQLQRQSSVFSQTTVRQLLQDAPSIRSDLPQSVCGWIRTARHTKNQTFMEVSDGSTSKGMQCLLSPELARLYSDDLAVGACIQCEGLLKPSPGREQDWEMVVEKVHILGQCKSDEQWTYPLQKKAHSLAFLRQWSHLRQRTRLFSAILTLRHHVTRQIHEYLSEKHHFKHLHTPLLTSMDCEGGGEVFQVVADSPLNEVKDKVREVHHEKLNEVQSTCHENTAKLSNDTNNEGNDNRREKQVEPMDAKGDSNFFFERPTFLTVSAQLHLELGVHSHSRVYTLSPCFRADTGSRDSSRHLAEFYMLETEWAFPSSLNELLDVCEDFVRSVVQSASERCATELEYLEQQQRQQKKNPGKVPVLALRDNLHHLFGANAPPFERLTYTECVPILQRANKRFTIPFTGWGQPLQTEHERYLCAHMGNRPVFVTDYPQSCKPFYMRLNEECLNEKTTVACFDLLVPGIGELVGGSLREERWSLLQQRMEVEGLLSDDEKRQMYGWYLDLRRVGSCPHGGFGLGLDRLIMLMTGMENIRDVVLVSRFRTKCEY